MKARLAVCEPQLPNWQVPNSRHRCRCIHSWWNGRWAAGPSQRSHCKPWGTGSSPWGGCLRSAPPPSFQTCISLIWPSVPLRMSSSARRNAPLYVPWLPIDVATLCLRASSRRARDSESVRVSGFSQKTGLPALMAAAETTACEWSGVATTTASICLPISSSILRKSANVFGFVSARRVNSAPALCSQSLGEVA